MKNITIILAIVGVFIALFFSHIDRLTSQYDPDLGYKQFYASQWSIPESKNPISDETLYQISGYDLVTTGVHFKFSPEVPPLGKLFYGWSILLLNNAYIISFILFIITSLVFYKVSGYFVESTTLRLFVTLLFTADPMLNSMSYMTLMDIPQLLFILLHMWVLFAYLKRKKTTLKQDILFTTLLGITFGAFAAVKIALLAVVILGADALVLFRKKKIFYTINILVTSLLTYGMVYISYLLQGNSIIDLLKAQKWMLTFYSTSQAKPVYGTVFTSLFAGYIKGWHEGATWVRVAEWSFLWPIYSLFTLILFFKNLMNIWKDNYLLYTYLLLGGLIGMYIIIPFFARYLVLVIPLLILCTGYFIEQILKPYVK